MALANTTQMSIQTGGTTTAGAGFDAGNSNMDTHLAATVANTASPLVSCSTYNFVARDVGHWLFVKSGTSWTPGWYQIASVAANKATLTANIGTSPLVAGIVNTAAGCATVASPTTGTWSIDYSQTNAVGVAFTDMTAAGAGSTFTSAANPVGPNFIGNIINITSGTNFNTGRFQILSTSSTTATMDSAITTGATSDGAGNLGGAHSDPSLVAAFMVAGNYLWLKSGTYSITSASNNTAGGCVSLTATASGSNQTKLIGFGSIRYDNGTKPLLQAGNAINTFTIITTATGVRVENVTVDGATLTSSRGIFVASSSEVVRCKAVNCTNSGLFGNSGSALQVLCEVTACSTAVAMQAGQAFACAIHDNTITGMTVPNSAGSSFCIVANNTGATSDGVNTTGGSCVLNNIVSYNNGRHGFLFNQSTAPVIGVNLIAAGNAAVGAFGFTASSKMDTLYLYNCADGSGNTQGQDTSKILAANNIGFITCTATPFNGAATNDFSINNNAGAGASLRAAGVPAASGNLAIPGMSTAVYLDVGVAQHKDLSVGSGLAWGFGHFRFG